MPSDTTSVPEEMQKLLEKYLQYQLENGHGKAPLPFDPQGSRHAMKKKLEEARRRFENMQNSTAVSMQALTNTEAEQPYSYATLGIIAVAIVICAYLIYLLYQRCSSSTKNSTPIDMESDD